MPLRVEPDCALLVPLLQEDHIGNLTLAGELQSAEPNRIEVFIDRERDPSGVVVRTRSIRLYARDLEALRRLEPAISDFTDRSEDEVMFAGVKGWACREIARKRNLAWESPCWLYYLAPASYRPREHPRDVRPLEPQHAELVARNWDLGGEDAADYLRTRIESGPSSAVYVGGNPVSWSLTHDDGQMGAMYTLPGERRRGYGAAVTFYLVEQILKLGGVPFLYVKQDNEAGRLAAEAMGFARWGDYRWFGLRRQSRGLQPT